MAFYLCTQLNTQKVLTGNSVLNKECMQPRIMCCGRDIKVCNEIEKDKEIFLHMQR